MLGFFTRYFIVRDGLLFNYYFIIPKAYSLLPCSTPFTVVNTTLISTYRETIVTRAVLRNQHAERNALLRERPRPLCEVPRDPHYGPSSNQ
jgi:hypothetical protein